MKGTILHTFLLSVCLLSACAATPPVAEPAAAATVGDDPVMARAQVECPGFASWFGEMKRQAETTAKPRESGSVTEPELRSRLLAMMKADQEARMAADLPSPAQDASGQQAAWARVAAVDSANQPRIKRIIERYGVPSPAMVGRDGAFAVFLLVQHADTDPAFQAQVLELFKPAAERGDVRKADLALLTDRVRIAQRRPQRYGSQFSGREGIYRPSPTEDFAHIDERRAAMELPPMADYVCFMHVSDPGHDYQLVPWAEFAAPLQPRPEPITPAASAAPSSTPAPAP